jgi:pimeloyl-ACP methyl ester carboxylesterase
VAIANPLRSVSGDAAYVRDVIGGIGGPVVLVEHSYGGIVITEAAAGNEAVVGLVYVAGFAPDHAESAFELSTMFPGSTLAGALTIYPLTSGGDELAITREQFHHQFAADVPAEQAALMAAPCDRVGPSGCGHRIASVEALVSPPVAGEAGIGKTVPAGGSGAAWRTWHCAPPEGIAGAAALRPGSALGTSTDASTPRPGDAKS